MRPARAPGTRPPRAPARAPRRRGGRPPGARGRARRWRIPPAPGSLPGQTVCGRRELARPVRRATSRCARSSIAGTGATSPPISAAQRRLELTHALELLADAPAGLGSPETELGLHALQGGAHRGQVREPLARLLPHGPRDHRGQRRGHAGTHLGQRRRLHGAQLLQEVHGVLPDDGGPVREELVEHAPEREHVRAVIGLAARLLRGHVAQAAHQQARPRQAARRRRHVGDAEVHDLGDALLEHDDVAGLDVAVDHAVLVRVVQAAADLDHEADLVLEIHGAALGDHVPQLLPLQELHHDEEAPVVLPHVVDRDDVRVVQLGAGLRLEEEAGAELLGDLDVVGDDLERDGAVEDRGRGRGRPCPCRPGRSDRGSRTCRSCGS